MDNSNQLLEESVQVNSSKASWPLISFIILVVIAIGIAWQFTGTKPEPIAAEKTISVPVTLPVIKPKIEEKVTIAESTVVESSVEKPELAMKEDKLESTKSSLPSLNESDAWLKLKLPEITWRKELLMLVVDEDMIRRFVVFTDNFSQGIIAYEHSPLVLPKVKFTPKADSASQNVWQWDENSSKRFSIYIDLLRSIDSNSLVQWYLEVKPLIDESYQELGYEDDFTYTLQSAITRILDMELPKSSMALIQPSVMYKFANPALEALPDSDKLLLRLGKDNLLVMKSVLLELHEKLAQQKNGVHQ